jgi:hypothetical protein
MAKANTQASDTPAAAEKAKRETRVAFVVGSDGAFESVTFKKPGGESVTLPRAEFASKTLDHALMYGVRRLYQDGLAGEIKDGGNADEAAQTLIDRMVSGDWTTRRGPSDGRPTMESVARAIVAAKYPALAKSGDEFKSKVVALLDESADAARYAKVRGAFDAAMATWEASRATDVDI